MTHHGGRDDPTGVTLPTVVVHQPSEWLVGAVHAALGRASCCEHIAPGVPAGLVLRSGWVNCKSPACSVNCPADMRVQPPSGVLACERCGSETDVMVAYALSDVLDVAYLTCAACHSIEVPRLTERSDHR